MKFNKETFEIIFFARAGQGAKSIAESLAQAAVSEGRFVQAFSFYGPQRSGAPTKAFVKISSNPIRNHEPIIDPDIVVVLDDTLITSEDVGNNITENESVIVNTRKTEEEIRKDVKNFNGNIKTIDASGIALDTIGMIQPNGVILGKLVGVTEIVKLESVMSQFRNIFEKKIGEELTQKNLLAIEKGYDAL
ncbi:MAG: 2-oxoacid:acceptor oxidoreductase family protein [Candidatus Moranbacteria bacterium]|jgi:pyruvate ferredoxin oxidoreductase gamma subunit|nr:2-oxoacid:acceptor oxidoreductase family protein [Candidatus Moranbacteria bacterium]